MDCVRLKLNSGKEWNIFVSEYQIYGTLLVVTVTLNPINTEINLTCLYISIYFVTVGFKVLGTDIIRITLKELRRCTQRYYRLEFRKKDT
jgi:hypothetical protein